MTIKLANARKVALLAAAMVFAPPPAIDYEAWARDNIVFTKRESELPGAYNRDLFPFFSEVLKALGPDDPCRIVTLAKSAQIGGTVLANIFTLGTQALDPCDFLYVHPTDDNAVRWSKLKLKPMLKGTAAVASLFPSKSRDGGDSILFKERVDGRGAIVISGANSPASLSMISMPRQVQDDLSKWEMNPAGDPEAQADSRSQGREFAKIYKASTPLIAPGCRITANYEKGSQEVYLVPCPHCGHEQTLEWENMLANLDEDRPEEAHFTCAECGAEIRQHQRAEMVRKGRWQARNPKAARYHRSFYLWAAYAPLTSWELIARAWLDAKGKPGAEQVFLNDKIGRAYQVKGEAPPWEKLRDRANAIGHERHVIPQPGLLLTIGIDVQKDRVEWQLVAYGRESRRYVVDVGVITGHISEPECQAHLDLLLQREWRHASRRLLKADLAAIDGNAWTEEVWSWAKRHPSSRVIMVRGAGSDQAPALMRVKKERNRRGEVIKYSRRFYTFNTSVPKMALYRSLAKEDPLDRAYVGLPQGLDDEYFRQLTAEHRKAVKRKDGFTDYKWVKEDNQANEALDTMNQSWAAALKLGILDYTDKAWDRLEAERATPLPEAQLDFEDLPLLPKSELASRVVVRPPAKPLHRPRRGFVKNF